MATSAARGLGMKGVGTGLAGMVGVEAGNLAAMPKSLSFHVFVLADHSTKFSKELIQGIYCLQV